MDFKENKWYNHGDVHPREHGGVFVRRVGNEIEVVQTTNNEDHGGVGYTIHSRADYIDELKERFSIFKTDPDKRSENNAVGSYADWKRFIQMEEDGVSLDDILFYLAADMVSYYGGDSEPDVGTNYWDLLAIHDITYRNYK
jgi:hypothetical protein